MENEAIKRIENAEKELKAAKEAFGKQNEVIRVPECIKFGFTNSSRLGIIFNDSKQMLHYECGAYKVHSPREVKDGSNFKLTKCERSDLKAGDVAFMMGFGGRIDHWKRKLNRYCIILSDAQDVTIEGNNCIVFSNNGGDWYKVEKI